MARAGREGTVVVLGSFYLVGELRDRWYAKRDVVLQRTSWPTRGAVQAPLDWEKKRRSASRSRGSS